MIGKYHLDLTLEIELERRVSQREKWDVDAQPVAATGRALETCDSAIKRSMPLPKPPYVASAEQVRITRSGDAAIIEYADESVAATHFTVGAEKLAKMTDEEVLQLWNDGLSAMESHRRTFNYVATEVPAGKPQVEYFAAGDQWTPRGHVLRCEILSDAAIEPSLDEPFVSIDGRDFTLAEFMKLIGTCGGWGMRIEFVPADELHKRPKVRVREPAKQR